MCFKYPIIFAVTIGSTVTDIATLQHEKVDINDRWTIKTTWKKSNPCIQKIHHQLPRAASTASVTADICPVSSRFCSTHAFLNVWMYSKNVLVELNAIWKAAMEWHVKYSTDITSFYVIVRHIRNFAVNEHYIRHIRCRNNARNGL